VLYVINDSGNAPRLYAISETGQRLATWQVDAKNRDWEDMASIEISGTRYLVIGDTGDNLKTRRRSVLYLLREPSISPDDKHQLRTLVPEHKVVFNYSDGPRNVEAFSAIGSQLFLISKEPLNGGSPTSAAVYQLTLDENTLGKKLIAARISSLAPQSSSVASRLVASLTGVDLNHVTAMDIDPVSNTAYLLTYRHVLKIQRHASQSWSDAFSGPAKRIHTHELRQAEALAVSPSRAVWFSSELRYAPLWAIPIKQ